ncbi:hypothetical protein R8Z50_06775 [Longispora sp. K20-0274]|uniref:hypothetical protein n=1 Tax=Longispora sp. K20-0274 TaxID=3088255 RepID=UPI0039996173
MSISYEEAREIARRAVEPAWTHGTFCVDDRVIYETDQYYVVSIAARELVVDGDQSYMLYGGVHVVYKADGKLGMLPAPTVYTDPTIRSRKNPNPTLR